MTISVSVGIRENWNWNHGKKRYKTILWEDSDLLETQETPQNTKQGIKGNQEKQDEYQGLKMRQEEEEEKKWNSWILRRLLFPHFWSMTSSNERENLIYM